VTGRSRVALHAGLATMAAASALGAVFAGWSWIPPVLAGIAVVAITSELVRWSPVPSGLSPVIAAGVYLCYLTAVYGAGSGYAGFIPTSTSMHVLSDLARAGFHDIRRLGTPVPTHRGLVLIAGVGLAAVALVVDLLAVTMRRAAVAGLPLLATFALCTSIAKHGSGWVPFTIGATGYLWLLLADSRDRLSRWGRPLGVDPKRKFTWSDQDVVPSPLSVMGRRIGLSAIAIGVVVPLAIPGLRGGIPHGHGGLGVGHGGSNSAVTINPIVTIGAELTSGPTTTVLHYTTTDPDPTYLRLTSLDKFDGNSFAPTTLQEPAQSSVRNGIAGPAQGGAPERTTVDVQGLEVHWLPVPMQPVGVQVTGDWRYASDANTIFSARNDTHGLEYSVQSVHQRLTATQLRTATPSADLVNSTYLSVPPALASQVTPIVRHVIQGSRTPFAAAVAIQNYLTGAPFTYNTHVRPLDSSAALLQFLTVTHTGFCQQYAAAMAVMARLVGIPARVAVGFTHGNRQTDGSWVVTTKDAHAWPELYLGQFGWVPFEPTPRADGQADPPTYSIAASTNKSGGGTDGGSSQGGNGRTAARSHQPSKNQRLDQLADAATSPGPARPAPAGHHSNARAWFGWALLVLLLLAVVVPSTARNIGRRLRWRRATTSAERAGAGWQELRAAALDAHLGWVDGLTPRATARLVRAEGGLDPAADDALQRIVAAAERAWYSPRTDIAGTDALAADVDRVRVALVARARPIDRLAMRLWPRSTLLAGRELVGCPAGAPSAPRGGCARTAAAGVARERPWHVAGC
jgi:transglutaminase-like putative cysteine protease